MQELSCKIMRLKAKRNLTLLFASSSDFVSANVILNQHQVILTCATDGTKLWDKSICNLTVVKS